MVTVDVDGSSLLMDSQPKLIWSVGWQPPDAESPAFIK